MIYLFIFNLRDMADEVKSQSLLLKMATCYFLNRWTDSKIIKISLIKWHILYKIGVKYFLIDPLFWVLPLVILLKITSFLPFSFKPGPESKTFTSVTPIIFEFYIYPRNAISLDKLMWPTGPKSQYFEIFFIFHLKWNYD